jgi:single-stranded DNA-binding protein
MYYRTIVYNLLTTYMNRQRIELIGYTVVKPELLTSKEKKEYAKVRIAINRDNPKAPSEKKSEVTYYDILVFGKRAEKSKEIEKGMLVRTVGDLEVKPYITKKGEAKVGLTVLAREFQMLDPLIY